MSGSETDIQWFIARDGKQHGPVSDLELKKLMELAHLKPTDLIWRQGFSDWRTAASVFPTIVDTPRPAQPARSPAAPKAAGPSAPKAPTPASPSAAGPGSPSSGHSSPQQAKTPASAAPAAAAGGRPAPSSASGGYAPHAGAPASAPSSASGGDRSPMAGRAPNLGDARPDRAGTHPLGNAPRQSGPAPQAAPASQHLGPETRIGPGPSVHHEPPAPTRRRKAPLIAAGLLVMAGVGAWLGSQYTDAMFALVQSDSERASEQAETATANLSPGPENKAAAEAISPPAAPEASSAATTPTLQDVDRSLQGRTVWVSVKQEFPDWYQSRLADVARLTGENKSQAEITSFLVNQLVQLRRENAKHALAASSPRHKDLAAAFLANLRELAREGGDGCYDFISRGETSAVIIRRMQDPSQSVQIEAQLVAVVAAIAEGRREPSQHAAPVKTDYDLLAGELGRLGWTQADMQLFANPKELAQAPRERVCSMLQDWFAAHLAIQDQASQQRLLFETLKPVVSG